MSLPLVDIIVSSYNCKHELIACIACVRAQTFPHYRLTIVDNASTDGTHEYLEHLRSIEPTIQVIENPQNLGHMISVAGAYAKTSAPYVWQLHGDDLIATTFLEQVLHQGLCKHPQSSFAYSLFSRLVNGQLIPDTHQYIADLPTGEHRVTDFLCLTNWILQSFTVFRREHFDAVGGFERHINKMNSDDSVAARVGFLDHYMWARLSTVGHAYVVQERLGSYRIHENSQWTLSNKRRRTIQEAVRTYDFIYDDHHLFDDVCRYLAKANQFGRLLTQNGIIKTAFDFILSNDTGPEILPIRKAFLTRMLAALTLMKFDSSEIPQPIYLEHPTTLNMLKFKLKGIPEDPPSEALADPMATRVFDREAWDKAMARERQKRLTANR